jgi:alpha-tubulin suppressor-like RCC1 family protein/subtilisin family serine protease
VVEAVAIALALGATLLPYPGPAPSVAAARSVDPAPTAPTAPAAAPNPDGPRPDRPNARHATDQVVLAFSRSLTKAEARGVGRLRSLSAAAHAPVSFVRLLDARHGVYRLSAPLGDAGEATLAALGTVADVERAEPDSIVSVADLPNDPDADQLWGLAGPGDGSPFGIDAIGAWTTTHGAGVTVAVIDTGLVAHPDLAGQTIPGGYDFVGDTGISGDGDGRDANPSDPGCPGGGTVWHGTHVAGTIAAIADNGIGVFGAAPMSKVLVVRALGGCGSGYLSDAADAIRWAAGGSVSGVPPNAHPAQVLNMSFGAGVACETYLQAAVDDARSHGAVVVAAAGNDGVDAGSFEPASCAGVIAVAAIDSNGLKAAFSNFGPHVAIAGPGVGILSTANDGTTAPAAAGYRSYNGTSMASPHIAATAALILAANPGLDADAVALAMRSTATPLAPDASASGCAALGCGAGVANANGALTALAGPTPIVGDVRVSAGSVLPSGSITLTALAVQPAGVTAAEWSIDNVSWAPMSAVDGSFGEASERATTTFTAPTAEGTYDACVRASHGASVSDGTACGSFVVNAGPPAITIPVLAPSVAAIGSAVQVTATATDPTRVGSADVRIDGRSWRPLAASDGAFDETIEAVTGPIGGAVTGIAAGQFHSCAALADGTARCWGTNNSGQLGDGTTTLRPLPVTVDGLATVTAVATGSYHSCARLADGSVECWGGNWAGQLGDGSTVPRPTPVPVPGITSATAISAGYGDTCALLDDGTVTCWGADGVGQLGDGSGGGGLAPVAVTGLDSVVAIDVGLQHACAVRSDGTVWCWGWNASGQLGDGTRIDRSAPVAVAGLTGAVAITAGDRHSCALLDDGTVRCWGANSGQLGDGTTTDRLTPVAVAGLDQVTAVSGGSTHTCALIDDGTVRCWGGNRMSQIGDGTTTWRLTPVAVADVSGVTAIAAGLWHTCAEVGDGTARCWGNNWNGQFGDGTLQTPSVNVVMPASTVAGIGALTGGTHTICVRATDTSGESSAGTTCATLTVSDATAPGVALFTPPGSAASGTSLSYQLTFSEPVTGLTAGDFTIAGTSTGWSVTGVTGSGAGPYAISLSGAASTVGAVTLTLSAHAVADRSANLGPAVASSAAPVTIDRTKPALGAPVAAPPVAAGGDPVEVTATATDATAVASGQLSLDGGPWRAMAAADGAFGSPSEGLDASVGARVVRVDPGVYHTCALLGDGTVRCSGGNFWGELGDGSTVGRLAPVEVQGIAGAVALTADERASCAVLGDGAVRCWGDNENGQLGDGTHVDRLSPVAVAGLSGVADVSNGVTHTCALRDDGTVGCWGWNGKGQLGHGAIAEAVTPVDVIGLTDATSIAAGYLHTCALQAGGTVSCWGDNEFGQLGDGTTIDRLTPVAVPGLSGVVAIAAGGHDTCAVLASGAARCWGWNTFGQIGDGTTTTRLTPTPVAGLTGATAIATSGANTCAVLASGLARCWGANGSGQLGDGTTIDRLTPVAVAGLTGAVAIAAGGEHTCAQKSDGTARCWGRNSAVYGFGAGRLGDGTATDRLAPVAPLGIGSLPGGAHGTCVRATDSASNTSTAPACTTFTVDATAPTASLIPAAVNTNAATLSYGLSFGEPVTGLSSADLTLSGSATGCLLGTPAGSGSSYAVEITGCSEGTVELSIAAGSVVDVVGNAGPVIDVAATSVTVDRTAPTATLTAPASPTAAFTLTYLVGFDESVAGLTAADFEVSGSATGCIVSDPTGSAASSIVDVTGCSEGTLVLTLVAGGVADLAGNTAPAVDIAAGVVTVDRGPAATLSCLPGSGPTNAVSLACSATFGEAPGGATSFTTDDVLIGGSATGWAAGEPVGSGSGPYTFTVTGAGSDGSLSVAIAAGAVTDGSGNPSLASATLALSIDRTLPASSAPSQSLRVGATLGTSSIPIHLAWSGSDGAGSGVATYTLERSTNGGPWTSVASTLVTRSADVTVAASGTVRYRVRAVDKAGNVGPWATGPTLTPRTIQQSSTTIRYRGTWTTRLSSAYSGGSVRSASAAGASATSVWTGRSIALVSTMAPARGKVRIYVNGSLVATVDLRATSWRNRVIVWQKTWSTSAPRTITIVVAGTSGRPRVDLDAFASLK